MTISSTDAGGSDASAGLIVSDPVSASPAPSDDIVLLHGFMGAPWTMRLLARRFSSEGFRTYPLWYDSWMQPFDTIVHRICDRIDALTLGQKRPLHFIGHSMGGLVARAVVSSRRPCNMGRMVMMGTPNNGSEMADFCARYPLLRPVLGQARAALITRNRHPLISAFGEPDYLIGIIAGDRPLAPVMNVLPAPHDGKVSVAATHIDREADHIVLPVTHALMPFDRQVQRQALHFLRKGRFQR